MSGPVPSEGSRVFCLEPADRAVEHLGGLVVLDSPVSLQVLLQVELTGTLITLVSLLLCVDLGDVVPHQTSPFIPFLTG